jgi:hypothetical protein
LGGEQPLEEADCQRAVGLARQLPEKADFRQVAGGCQRVAGDFQQVAADFRQVVRGCQRAAEDFPRAVQQMAEAGCPWEAEHSVPRLGRLLPGADSWMVGVAPMVAGVLLQLGVLLLLGVLLAAVALPSLRLPKGGQQEQCQALLPTSIAH